MSDPRQRDFLLLGNLLHFHAFSDETGGRMTVVESRCAPGAGAPPNHHAREEEAFFVLEGRFTFTIDGASRAAGPGEFVRIPGGALHAFSCTGETPGRLLILNAPGRVHDVFFAEAGRPVPAGTREIPAEDGAPDIPAILAVAERAGMTIVAPAPAPG